ncbi:protein lethal(2)essential for life-like [Uloborus diversus]|uniref:protein lethal(2)essential for life-like n=1 Tax=Uloborus diversus TaxID=327109 RepID=UPI0024092751|nr:protein lethal(2)essential for life-like [Uloborus diversus]
MALSSLFDDFPLLSWDNGHRRRARGRPLLINILDSLEDTLDQKVGHVFRRLPSALLDLEDDYERSGNGRKRKLRSESTLSPYEPKSKVLVSSKDNKFKISMDTANYQPEEITVKIVNDKIAISAKHEAKGKDVYEFSEMYRSFDLPDNVDPATVTSHLSANGQLTVEAPLKALEESSTTRNIPITFENKEKESNAAKTPTKDQSQDKE